MLCTIVCINRDIYTRVDVGCHVSTLGHHSLRIATACFLVMIEVSSAVHLLLQVLHSWQC